ncbi:MAG: hypothetical protein ACXV5Q_14450 [Frankiaceae bacterium]
MPVTGNVDESASRAGAGPAGTRTGGDSAWAALVRPLARSAERALLSVVEAVAANVTGTRLAFDLAGRQLSFVLDEVRAERLPGPGGALHGALHLVASELTLAGVRVERARALVPKLRIEGGTRPHVVSDRIHVELDVAREALAGWLAHALPGSAVTARPDGLVSLRPAGWLYDLVVCPSFAGRAVQVRLHRIGMLGFEVPLPRLLAPRRTVSLRSPAPEIQIVDLEETPANLRVHLHHTGLRQPLRLAHLWDVASRWLTGAATAVAASADDASGQVQPRRGGGHPRVVGAEERVPPRRGKIGTGRWVQRQRAVGLHRERDVDEPLFVVARVRGRPPAGSG